MLQTVSISYITLIFAPILITKEVVDATTLYARLGGDAAVEATVDIFYNRVRRYRYTLHYLRLILTLTCPW